MRAGIFSTTIEKMKDIGISDCRHFTLRFASETHFEFDAGQFLNILIPHPEKPFKRPYSIASSPTWKGTLDLCWKKIPGGAATEYLWRLKEGDFLQIQAPLGRFTLKEPYPKKIIFISTGTGIAPFRAMMHDLIERKVDIEIVNIFGNRYEQDILYQEEFEKLAEKSNKVKNIFTVSRPVKWKGETEYVQHVLKKNVVFEKDTQIYICGLSAMIAEVEVIAKEMGFTKEQIIYEKYD